MRSMTGFGQAAAANGRHQVSVTLRSVNSRYLDLALRLKDEYRAVEAELRRRLEAVVARGRLDVTVDVRPVRQPGATVEVQMEVVRALHEASHALAEKGLVGQELGARRPPAAARSVAGAHRARPARRRRPGAGAARRRCGARRAARGPRARGIRAARPSSPSASANSRLRRRGCDRVLRACASACRRGCAAVSASCSATPASTSRASPRRWRSSSIAATSPRR